jgi:iron complex outermembrane receptor protein
MVNVWCRSQTCTLSISGIIQDVDNNQTLPGATVLIKEINKTTTSEKSGAFNFNGICAGNYIIIVTFVGYDSIHVNLRVDSNIDTLFQLSHRRTTLSNVLVVTERKQDISTNAKSELASQQLFQTLGQTLGESLKGLPGLNSIQTGPSISKPVIHGLHSNRLLILNNGVRQEGQQWGSEHAPEIDPFIANKITVIKGAASVRYGSDAIVGVILVEPKTLDPEKNFRAN